MKRRQRNESVTQGMDRLSSETYIFNHGSSSNSPHRSRQAMSGDDQSPDDQDDANGMNNRTRGPSRHEPVHHYDISTSDMYSPTGSNGEGDRVTALHEVTDVSGGESSTTTPSGRRAGKRAASSSGYETMTSAADSSSGADTAHRNRQDSMSASEGGNGFEAGSSWHGGAQDRHGTNSGGGGGVGGHHSAGYGSSTITSSSEDDNASSATHATSAGIARTGSGQHETASDMDDEMDSEYEASWHRWRNQRILLSRLQEVSSRGRLAMINLARRGLTVTEAPLLCETIRANPHLSVLKLAYNELGDDGVSILAKGIRDEANGRHHGSLSLLDLGFNSIGDAGCEMLAVNALAGNFTLQTLYLAANCFGEKGALSIAGAILHGTSLARLHLTANRIGSTGVKGLACAIAKTAASVSPDNQSNQGFLELHVDDTNMDDAGFIALPGMLLSNTTLRMLSIANNHLEDRDIMMLAQAFTQNKMIPMEVLNLSFNAITCEGLECLMNAVWGSETLKVLRFDNNRLKDRGAQLCAVVLTSIPLEILDLSFNRITTVGIKALMKNLSENNSLQLLGISGIPIDQNGSKAIAFALAYNTSLRILYMDNSAAGYSAQRHIVAGVVSNQRCSLRTFTGFPLAPIAITLGMPKIPQQWANEQLLGFLRMMWQQWRLKSARGNNENAEFARGPAPPSAVATAAKVALSSLGGTPESMFRSEAHEKPLIDGSPADCAKSSFLERSMSGTLAFPEFGDGLEGERIDILDERGEIGASSPSSSMTAPLSAPRGPLDNPVRRNRNLQWLRRNFRAISDIGGLPFNKADMWQLHQYYFSPPSKHKPDSTERDASADSHDPTPTTQRQAAGTAPVEYVVSVQAPASSEKLHETNGSPSNNKRRSDGDTLPQDGPAAKRVKNLKQRIAFYPRIMTKVQSVGSHSMHTALSLMRQLKYVENILFVGDYSGKTELDFDYADVEMILLDLL